MTVRSGLRIVLAPLGVLGLQAGAARWFVRTAEEAWRRRARDLGACSLPRLDLGAGAPFLKGAGYDRLLSLTTGSPT